MKEEDNVLGDDGGSKDLETVPEEPAAAEQSNTEVEGDEGREEGGGKEKQGKNEDTGEFAFPDTTISLAHLQPSR